MVQMFAGKLRQGIKNIAEVNDYAEMFDQNNRRVRFFLAHYLWIYDPGIALANDKIW